MRLLQGRVLRWCLPPLTVVIATGLIRWARTPAALVVSPETTYITSPLLPDGRPDYLTFLNERASQGITAENNAAVPLALIAFPYEIHGDPGEYLKALGIPEPASQAPLLLVVTRVRVEGTQLPKNEEDVSIHPELFNKDQHPWHREHLEDHDAELTDLVGQLTMRDRYFSPLIWNEETLLARCVIQNLNVAHEIDDLLIMRSRLRLQNGDRSGAWNDIVQVIRLGRLVSQGITTGELSTGFKIEQHGIDAICNQLSTGELTIAEIRGLRAQWTQLPAPSDILDRVNVDMRVSQLDPIAALRANPVGPGFTLYLRGRPRLAADVNVNDVLHSINLRHDKLVEILRSTSDIQERNAKVAAIDATINSSLWKVSPSDNMDQLYSQFGLKAPISISMEQLAGYGHPVQGVLNISDSAQVRRVLLDMTLALAEFHAINEKYPENLEELAPDFFTKIPLDPWRNAPYSYKRTSDGFSLYSFGRNARDDGGWTGRESEEGQISDDIQIGLRPLEISDPLSSVDGE